MGARRYLKYFLLSFLVGIVATAIVFVMVPRTKQTVQDIATKPITVTRLSEEAERKIFREMLKAEGFAPFEEVYLVINNQKTIPALHELDKMGRKITGLLVINDNPQIHFFLCMRHGTTEKEVPLFIWDEGQQIKKARDPVFVSDKAKK